MSATLMNAILQTSSLAYLLTDHNLMISEAGGAERLLPASVATLVGASLFDAFPALRARSEQLAAVRYGTASVLRWEQRVGRVLLACVIVAHGAPANGALLVTVRRVDGTRRPRRTGAALEKGRQSRQQAVTQVPLVPLLLSTTMHELRTPLTVVTGYLSLLLDEACGPLAPAQTAALQTVARNVQQIQQLSADLLDTARIGSGQILLRPNAVDLRRVIERVIDDYQPQLAAHGQHVTLDAPPDLPYVWCDELRATQILMNLIGNASKYSPDGGRVAVSLCAAGSFVQVAVADSGIGIMPNDQQHVFNPFYRATNTEHAAASGSGLGLYVTRALVEAHGGAIWLKSTPHQGSTFYLTLPQTAPIAAHAYDA
ncbi:MAG: HAMP domain-containing histidine kinase [Chloroflexales bacterium]|nr:HAMP domain-containing histidine kinase [Chloroflexales bacterium]